MKLLAVFAVVLLLAAAASAQDLPSQSMTRGTWELAPFVGGGSGLGKSSSTQFFDVGGRAGLVLTGEHLPGFLRGNFEWAVDAMPVYTVFTTSGAVYGGSFKPVIWQWNFTRGRKIAPYVAAAGGIVFSTDNVPPGDTSWVNFTSQFVVGTRIFTKPRRAFFFEGELGHISNASLGNHNPGYNITLLFSVGYSWFKGRR
ncbi:MAG TPA: acyloxyacyl hydrolase [Candidatus Acidoferrum sp.]|nr:acyloxyacyl hydrolase [Candidatus Acidoferrum sp.]